nr:hypothetical protein [Sphingopyxis sp. LC363]
MNTTHHGDATTIHLNPKIMAIADSGDHFVDGIIPRSGAIWTYTAKAVNAAISVGPIGPDAGDLIGRQFTVLF